MLKDDKDVKEIMDLVLDDFRILSPKMIEELRKEYDTAETFDDLSSFAMNMYSRTKNMLAAENTPFTLDDTYENQHWLTPTPDDLNIKSKAGLEVYLKEHGNMPMDAFKETPLYRMNKAVWDEMGV